MRARRLSGLTVLTVLSASVLALAACGGSGSSGFDLSPGALEAPLIERAIAEQSCVAGRDDLLICPSGVPAPGPDGGVPGPSDVRVEAGFASEVDCGIGDGCTLPIAVSTDGLPEGAQLRIAVRASTSNAWQVGEPIEAQPASGADEVVTPVELAGDPAPGEEVQVAVLVFVPPFGDVPPEVDALSETGARYAFVLSPVTLEPGASS